MLMLPKFPFRHLLLGAVLTGALAACGGADNTKMPAPPVPSSVADASAAAEADAAAGTGTNAGEAAASSGDCDAFLAGYEEYVNDYVALAKEMQADPSDAALLAKSSALSMKASGWVGKMQGCQNDAAFQAKYMALSARMATGMAQ